MPETSRPPGQGGSGLTQEQLVELLQQAQVESAQQGQYPTRVAHQMQQQLAAPAFSQQDIQTAQGQWSSMQKAIAGLMMSVAAAAAGGGATLMGPSEAEIRVIVQEHALALEDVQKIIDSSLEKTLANEKKVTEALREADARRMTAVETRLHSAEEAIDRLEKKERE